MNKRILKGEDLIEIASFLVEKGFDQGITVNISVDDKATLDKVNEDFFYRFASDEKTEGTPPEVGDELLINVSGIKFRYFVKQE